MIRKRSRKIPRRKSGKKSRKKSRKRSRSFGNFKTTDPIFNLFTNFINPNDLLKLLLYTKDLSDNAFKEKPDESIGLKGLKEHLEKFGVWLYRKRIDNFVENLTPAQIVLLTQGKYNDEIRKKIFYNIDPSLNAESRISGIKENAELFFLKSIFAKNLIKNIKLFLKSLSDTQLVLLINGQYDIGNSMFNAFLQTKYPTKIDKEELEEIIE